jgi:hypothetical protein
MNGETKNQPKSKISKKNKKGITMNFMYSVFGLGDNYREGTNPPRVGFFRKVLIKTQSIVISSINFINSLPL